MTSRRGFLAGLLATGLAPQPSWSGVGGPAFLSAAQTPEGTYRLFGLGERGQVLFSLPLPGRGHAGIAHPDKAEAVVFARRPGNFALVIDCMTGVNTATLYCPVGRHFYGHGVFSADGTLLFTPENDYESGLGVIGVWDRAKGYARISEFPSGGIGPHEIARLPGTDTLVVANGGIETHPDSGRAKLNLPFMQPNLSYLSGTGEILETVGLDPAMHLNSIRHLSVRPDGLVAFGMQWQGDSASSPPVLGFHRIGQEYRLAQSSRQQIADMQGYVGSVVFSRDGTRVAVSSPRGGRIQVFGARDAVYQTRFQTADVCGISTGTGDRDFVVTTGNGSIIGLQDDKPVVSQRHDVNWDNHAVQIS